MTLVEGMKHAASGRFAHHAPDLARPLEGGVPFGAGVVLVSPDRALAAAAQPGLLLSENGIFASSIDLRQ